MVAARRRRRPIVPILALLVTSLLVVVAIVGRSSSGLDDELAWLDEVRPAVERSNQLGLEVNDLRTQVPKLDGAGLARRIGRLADEARSILADVQRPRPPAHLRSASGLLVSCMALRARVTEELKPAFDVAAGSQLVREAVERFSMLGSELAAADRTYEQFLAALPAFREPVASRWITDASAWQPAALDGLVRTMRRTPALAPLHDVAVLALTTDPPLASTEGATQVLPVSKELRVQVVVANLGSEREQGVPVTATLAAPGSAPSTARQVVDLVPGQRLALELGGLEPAPSIPLALTVTVGPIADEANTANNSIGRTLVFRGSS